MSKLPFTDEQLRVAAAEVAEISSAALPDADSFDPPFDYSPAFLQKMDQLLKQTKKRARYLRLVKCAASFVLALLIGGGIWLSVSVEARAVFATWVREVYESRFVYRFFAHETDTQLAYYEIKNISSDYKKIYDKRNETGHLQKYDNGKQKIVFMYYPADEGTQHIVLNYSIYECEYVSADVNGRPADVYLLSDPTKANSIIWVDETAGLIFEISAQMDVQELVELAENVCLKK